MLKRLWAIIILCVLAGPTHAAGPGGRLKLAVTAPAPTITSVSPNNADQGSVALDVDVNGTGINSGCADTFSGTGITVNSSTWISSTDCRANITIDAAATASARDVTVTNTDGQSATSSAAFTVNTAAGATTFAVANSNGFIGVGASGAQSSSARTKQYANNVSSGNLLVAICVIVNTTAYDHPSNPFSDTSSNTWTVAEGPVDHRTDTAGTGGNFLSQYIAYAVSNAGSVKPTVSCTPSTSSFTSLYIGEFSRTTGTWTLFSHSNTGYNGNQFSTAPSTGMTCNANGLWIGAAAHISKTLQGGVYLPGTHPSSGVLAYYKTASADTAHSTASGEAAEYALNVGAPGGTCSDTKIDFKAEGFQGSGSILGAVFQ